MQTIHHIWESLDRGRRFVTHDVWYIGRPGEEIPHGFVIKQVRVLILLVQNLLEGAFLMRAAALTFTSLLSVVPCIAILFIIMQKLNLGVYAVQFVLEVVPRNAAVESASPLTHTANNGETIESGVGAIPDPGVAVQGTDRNEQVIRAFLHWLFADVSLQASRMKESTDKPVADPIEILMQFARNLSLHDGETKPSKIIGLATFVLMTVFGMMWNIESAFNGIWGVRRTRSWIRIFSDYTLIILLLPFVVAGVLGLTIALQNPSVRLGPFASMLRFAQYFTVWAAFALLYTVVPNTKVKWRYALLGGIVAGTLWCLGSWAYLHLQIGVTRNSLIYSSFALFPLLISWIYVSWIIVLFGAELTFAYQNERTFAMERHAAGASHAYREAVGVRAMVEIGHRFDMGSGGLSSEAAARAWNVPTRVINETLDQLEAAQLVRRCSTEPITYAPARSLDKMTVGDVVRALREAGREPSALREDEMLRPILDEINGAHNRFMDVSIETMAQRFTPLHTAIDVVGAEPKELPTPEPAVSKPQNL